MAELANLVIALCHNGLTPLWQFPIESSALADGSAQCGTSSQFYCHGSGIRIRGCK